MFNRFIDIELRFWAEWFNAESAAVIKTEIDDVLIDVNELT